MIVVSFGVVKSGSTLAFEMTKAVLELNGYPQPRLHDDLVEPTQNINFVGEWSDRRLNSLLEATREQRLVIKTHAGAQRLSPDLVERAMGEQDLKIQIVYRDPRDVVLSLLDHGVRARANDPPGPAFRHIVTLEDAISMLGAQLRDLRTWAPYPALTLQYERFAFDGDAGPEAIARSLGMSADATRVWDMVRGRFTQLHRGEAGRHKTDLWPDEIERIERAFPLYMQLIHGHDLGWFGAPA